MKKEAKDDLRSKPIEELREIVAEYREELLQGRIRGAIEGNGLGMRGRQLRRDIARCLTVIGEKSGGGRGKTIRRQRRRIRAEAERKARHERSIEAAAERKRERERQREVKKARRSEVKA